MKLQLDFLREWEAAERAAEVANRQREMAHEIIDQSPADRRVKALLHMLADMPRPTKDERGNWYVTASNPIMCARLNRSRNSVREYIRLATKTTYLEILTRGGDADVGTYVIHWRSILDRELPQPDATSTAQRSDTDLQDANSTADLGSGGSETIEGGGQYCDPGEAVPDHEGVSFDTEGGSIDRVNFDFDPVNSSPKRLQNVLREEEIQNTSLNVLDVFESPTEGQSRRNVRPMQLKFWRQWEAAVAASDLAIPMHVEQLYEMITGMVVISRSEANRRRVFETAAMNERMWKLGQAKTRKGLFTTNVAHQRWWANHLDSVLAGRMMQAVDRPSGAVSRAAHDLAAAMSIAAADAAEPRSKELEPPEKTFSSIDARIANYRKEWFPDG